MHAPAAAALIAILPYLTCAAIAQSPSASDQPAAEPAAPAPKPPEPETAKAWEFAINLTLVSGPDETYLQPTVTADHDWLHLEARYNYEGSDTTSLWVGYNLSFGEEEGITFDFTPMLGAVMGETNGIAPGYELTINWWKLELYTAGEFIVSTESKNDNFFYSWSQFTIAPADWLYAGVAFQRTRLYDSNREFDIGPIVGIVYKDLNISAYALNPEDDHPIFGLSVELSF